LIFLAASISQFDPLPSSSCSFKLSAPAAGSIEQPEYTAVGPARTRAHAMPNVFTKPENVLFLAGIALADVAALVSARQYVPTLHLSKTSFWNGTRINQIRFGSYPDTGLIE